MDDDELVRAYRNDVDVALEILYTRHYPRMLKIALYYFKSLEDAEDIASNSFVKAMDNLDSYTEGNFTTWLYTIVRNSCLNELRDSKKHSKLLHGRSNIFEVSEVNPLKTCETAEIRNRILGDMDCLTREHRKILMLFYYDDLSYEEIADIIDAPIGTVMSRMFRAKESLKDYLSSNLRDCLGE